jgi:adenylate cyclase
MAQRKGETVPPQQEQRVERRLSAIFAADVAGYSRMMSQAEAGTLRALAAAREVMDRLIGEHGGRIANTAGDSVLAEFPSAVDAVQCAVAVQENLTEVSAGVPEDRRLQFRIGIHVGDVVVRGADLLGDGVNIAARLEGLAEPGGIVISGAAHGYVRKALPIAYTDLGEQHVKNIDEQVRAYSVGSAVATASRPSESKPLPLPDKPSIAVLPFTNISADAEQEFFADGVTEDIITELSRINAFFVIARNSTFTYKSRAVDVKQVGQELGVRYVVEGSVRRMGDRVRITAQLIEAATGAHVWADRFDRKLAELFDVQDEVVRSIVASTQTQVVINEGARAEHAAKPELEVWELAKRGWKNVYGLTLESIEEARRRAQDY